MPLFLIIMVLCFCPCTVSQEIDYDDDDDDDRTHPHADSCSWTGGSCEWDYNMMPMTGDFPVAAAAAAEAHWLTSQQWSDGCNAKGGRKTREFLPQCSYLGFCNMHTPRWEEHLRMQMLILLACDCVHSPQMLLSQSNKVE